ncbi:MAG TPA: hypothetical protein VFI61_03820 [Patescibacteria group bacterium]|nr:hypothetical protein [Patescibacteria group bacterium]
MPEREIIERKYDENGNITFVVTIYDVKEKDDSQVLTKKGERPWVPGENEEKAVDVP